MKHKELLASDGKTVLADLIEQNFALMNVVMRLGMDLKMGRCQVAEVCRNAGIDVDTFMMLCWIYSYDDYVPAEHMIEKACVSDIVRYLHASHQYYTGTALVQLEKSLDDLLSPCTEKQKSAFWHFFSEYGQEVNRHFCYEEENVFPYLDALHKGNDTHGYCISQFAEHHSNIDEKLQDLKNLIMRYLPQECSNSLCQQTVSLIFNLQTDLYRHTRIEDDLLVAVVSRIEKNGRE